MTITWADFERVDMRVGVVVDAREFPEARRPAYKLWIDFGPLGVNNAHGRLRARWTSRCSTTISRPS